MPLYALGLNHQTAPLALRERVAVGPEALPGALAELTGLAGVEEAALLSTCNRTELYARVAPGAEGAVEAWLARHHGVEPAALADYLYRHHDDAAVRHLFRVATGLDSMVLGEPQILGQVKDAWARARDAHALKTPLDRLFQHTFQVAKRVRTDTRIGAHPVSVAFAAVRLAQQAFAKLDEATVLLVGAGETIELAARHLAEAKVKRLLVANRTLAHAQTLAAQFGGYALALADLPRHLAEADVVISATAAREPVVDAAMVRAALAQRRHRPMFLLDLAVPRDIDPAVAGLRDAFLYTVDDLEQVIEENRRSRREAAGEAEAIIDLQVGQFMAWWRAEDHQDVLKRLRAAGEAQRDEVLAKARAQLAAGKDPGQVLDFLANTLTNKLLHAPSAALRAAALAGDRELPRAAARLFDADAPTDAAGDARPDAPDAQPAPRP